MGRLLPQFSEFVQRDDFDCISHVVDVRQKFLVSRRVYRVVEVEVAEVQDPALLKLCGVIVNWVLGRSQSVTALSSNDTH